MTPQQHSTYIEFMRRETPTTSLRNVPAHTTAGVLVDYASAGLKIDVAVHHLDEALCSRQKLRAERALIALREGMAELEAWMKLSGYNV